MAFDPVALFKGELHFEMPLAALDDVRFDRIVRGFAAHYDVSQQDSISFQFARGEGYIRAGRWDAFGYVDSGRVVRIRQQTPEPYAESANVIAFQPRYAGLECRFNIRVLLIFWAFALAAGWWFGGGPFVAWAFAFLVAVIGSAQLTRASFRRKLNLWLARESWN